MDVRRSRGHGFTLVELLVVIGIIALLASILLPVLAMATGAARRANCSNKERQFFQGIRLYLNNSEEFFPLAWLKNGTGDENRLADLTYWRFMIQEQAESGFSRVIDNTPGSTDSAERKFQADRMFWLDPARGWTRDYFASPIIFKGHLKDVGSEKELDFTNTDSFDKHAQYTQVTQDVSSSERPIITEVDASSPLGDTAVDAWKNSNEDTTGNAHKTDLVNGWSCVVMASPPTGLDGDQVYVGVGRSCRTPGDYGTVSTRFDYRHNRAVNMLFLDGHVDSISDTNQAKMRSLHDYWNNLIPKTTGFE